MTLAFWAWVELGNIVEVKHFRGMKLDTAVFFMHSMIGL